jgi:hypothetical protein
MPGKAGQDVRLFGSDPIPGKQKLTLDNYVR